MATTNGRYRAQDRLYLIDASIYVFRAWFSIADNITDKAGNPTNAVYGFGYFLARLLEQARPTHIVALFDESLESSFRNRLYPAYKANREPAPPELKQQFRLCRQLCRALGIREMASRRYEADDLIGSLAQRFRATDRQVIIVSRDKDLVQLLQHHDLLWDFAEDRQLDRAAAHAHFGVRPEQMADFLALAGDSVDNIPGVPGVGKKTAQCLLRHFEDLDHIYAELQQVAALPMRAAGRMQDLLQQHRELAYLSRRLSRIHCDVKLRLEWQDLQWQPDTKKIQRFFTRVGVGARLQSRFEQLVRDS